MHWTTEAWQCTGCGVPVGHLHTPGCVYLSVSAPETKSADIVWLGPPVTPGMLPRLVVEGDPIAGLLACQHCDTPFGVGDVIFENRAQSIGLHAKCVLAMAAMIPRELPSPAEIETEFARRLAAIEETP